MLPKPKNVFVIIFTGQNIYSSVLDPVDNGGSTTSGVGSSSNPSSQRTTKPPAVTTPAPQGVTPTSVKLEEVLTDFGTADEIKDIKVLEVLISHKELGTDKGPGVIMKKEVPILLLSPPPTSQEKVDVLLEYLILFNFISENF